MLSLQWVVSRLDKPLHATQQTSSPNTLRRGLEGTLGKTCTLLLCFYSSLAIWLLASAGGRALGQMDPWYELTLTFVLSDELLRAALLVPDEADLVIAAHRAQEGSQ